MIRLVLFDIDGTLVNTCGAGAVAFDRALETVHGILDGTQSVDLAGRTDLSIARDLFEHHGVPIESDAFRKIFFVHAHWLAELLPTSEGMVLDGVEECLDWIAGTPTVPLIGLLTGNTRLTAEIKLRHFGLWRRFSTGAFGDDDACRNQLAAIALERARQILGTDLRGEETLIIGDTPRDIECAKSIGAHCISVATGGFSLEELQAHDPTHALESLLHVQQAMPDLTAHG